MYSCLDALRCSTTLKNINNGFTYSGIYPRNIEMPLGNSNIIVDAPIKIEKKIGPKTKRLNISNSCLTEIPLILAVHKQESKKRKSTSKHIEKSKSKKLKKLDDGVHRDEDIEETSSLINQSKCYLLIFS
jgi:hypothetical protein